MKNTDDLLMRADLDTLYGLLSKLSEKAKEDREMLPILLKLEEFVEIHKTRTRDMVTYRDTINKAREEYRSLYLKYTGTKETLEVTKKVLNEVMNAKMEGNEREDTDDLGF